MKKSIQIFMALIAAMLFTISCNKEDDTLKSKFVGDWYVAEGEFQFGDYRGAPKGATATFESSGIFRSGGYYGKYYTSGYVLHTRVGGVEQQCEIRSISDDVIELYCTGYRYKEGGPCKLKRVKK
ncbi:MAG: hypothetical protein J6Y32_00280 [Bacteroidales bacterium]|nr:hypothetical protein [Bacteroidales bacterium]